MKEKIAIGVVAFLLGMFTFASGLAIVAWHDPHHIAVVWVNEDGKAYAQKITKP